MGDVLRRHATAGGHVPLDDVLDLGAASLRLADRPGPAGDVDLRRKCALIIGSEGKGVSPRLVSAALDIRIPTRGVESLNASMAAGILLYEAFRQRQLPE